MTKVLKILSPILGAGAVGACPLCWLGTASLLTYLGIGALIPVWRNIVFALLVLGGLGFLLDFRSHRDIKPFILFVIGAIMLYLGRYVYGGPEFGGWQIWIPGGILVLVAVIYNRSFFRKTSSLL